MVSTVKSTISSAGIGSGLDVTSIISKLMGVEQLPLTALQSQATSMQTKLSSFGQIQSLVGTFQDAARKLTDKTAFTATKVAATSTSVTALTTATATPGNYSVSVSSIAAAQTAVSTPGQFTKATDVVGTGSLTLTLGSLSADKTTFTNKPDSTPITVSIDSSNNTLQGVADAINKAGAGVTASVVTDATGARLAITSNSTGAANGFKISAAEDTTTDPDTGTTTSTSPGLSRLAFDPTGGTSAMTLAQAASDTKAKVNGIDVTSATADLSNVVPGITFTAAAVTTAPVTIAVTKDTDAVKTLMTNFATAYNALNNYIESQTSYDASTKVAGLLQGDATTVSLQNQMRSMVTGAGSGSTVFATMSSMGFQMQKDGSLKLDDAAVGKALQNLPEMAKALANVDTTSSAKNGFAKKLNDWSTGLLSVNGAISTKETSIKAQITANGKSQTTMQDRLTATQARLTAQYNALDTTMSSANALAAYVQQQFFAKNTSSSS